MAGVEEQQAPDPISAVVVIGVSGSGKSTVGQQLAPAIEATFLEGDDYHSAANIAKMRAGVPLTDADREPWLKALGLAVGEHCRAGQSVVLACSALRRQYRETLTQAAQRDLTFIHLTIPPAVLAQRLQERQNHFMPASLLQSQLDTLEPLQVGEIGTEIAETGTVAQTVGAILDWLCRNAADTHDSECAEGRQSRPSLKDRASPPDPGHPAGR